MSDTLTKVAYVNKQGHSCIFSVLTVHSKHDGGSLWGNGDQVHSRYKEHDGQPAPQLREGDRCKMGHSSCICRTLFECGPNQRWICLPDILPRSFSFTCILLLILYPGMRMTLVPMRLSLT